MLSASTLALLAPWGWPQALHPTGNTHATPAPGFSHMQVAGEGAEAFLHPLPSILQHREHNKLERG